MIFSFSLYFLGIIAFVIHFFAISKQKRTTHKVFELLLLYQIVFILGVASLLTFWGLTFFGDDDVQGGEAFCSFAQELANLNLAFGILGLLSIRLRHLFWVATVFGYSIWRLASGIQNIYWRLIVGDGALDIRPYTNLIDPVLLLLLLSFYLWTQPKPAR